MCVPANGARVRACAAGWGSVHVACGCRASVVGMRTAIPLSECIPRIRWRNRAAGAGGAAGRRDAVHVAARGHRGPRRRRRRRGGWCTRAGHELVRPACAGVLLRHGGDADDVRNVPRRARARVGGLLARVRDWRAAPPPPPSLAATKTYGGTQVPAHARARWRAQRRGRWRGGGLGGSRGVRARRRRRRRRQRRARRRHGGAYSGGADRSVRGILSGRRGAH